MPTISVIVPVYNVEKYIHRCLDSILAQTFTDWECMLVDDGSPDNSGKICDEYAENDNRFKVIHKENGGVALARNTAVKQAKGKYITFVDSDDWVHADFLKVMFEAVKKYNGDICVSHALPTTKENENNYVISAESWPMNSREAISYYGKSGGSEFRGPFAKLIKAEIVLKCPFPEGRKIAEDLATNYRYYDSANVIVENKSRLYFYFINQSSVTNQKYNLERIKGLQSLEELLDYFEKNDYPDLYSFYKAEYCYDLFKQYANVHKHFDEPETEKQLLEKLRNITKLNIPNDVFTVEKLLKYIGKDNSELMNIFVFGFAKDLYRNLDKNITATKENVLTFNSKKQLVSLLRKYAKKCRITTYNYPAWFNAAFPKRMRLYWIIKGLKSKFCK